MPQMASSTTENDDRNDVQRFEELVQVVLIHGESTTFLRFRAGSRRADSTSNPQLPIE
jgi:hypothetical protein